MRKQLAVGMLTLALAAAQTTNIFAAERLNSENEPSAEAAKVVSVIAAEIEPNAKDGMVISVTATTDALDQEVNLDSSFKPVTAAEYEKTIEQCKKEYEKAVKEGKMKAEDAQKLLKEMEQTLKELKDGTIFMFHETKTDGNTVSVQIECTPASLANETEK